MTLTAPLADLRHALASVVAHAGRDPDVSHLHRVRVDVGPQVLTVAATNGFTAAVAVAPVVEHDGTLQTFDLSPDDVAKVLHLFRTRKGAADSMDQLLALDVTKANVQWTDVSGLFEGERLRLVRYPDADRFPDVRQLVADWVGSAGEPSDELVTHGGLLRLFTVAARQYGDHLVLRPSGGRHPLLVSCGDAFLGLLLPMHSDDTDAAVRRSSLHTWTRRLPTPRTRASAAAAALAMATMAVDLSDLADRRDTQDNADGDDVEGQADDAAAARSSRDDDEPHPDGAHLLLAAARVIVTEQVGSQTRLRVALGIGSPRAERLMHRLEDLGLVGPATPRVARRVLVDLDHAQEYLRALAEELGALPGADPGATS